MSNWIRPETRALVLARLERRFAVEPEATGAGLERASLLAGPGAPCRPGAEIMHRVRPSSAIFAGYSKARHDSKVGLPPGILEVNMYRVRVGSLLAMLTLFGCVTTQGDSGAAYVANSSTLLQPPAARIPSGAGPATAGLDIDAEVAEAASVEPQAHFPMKMGLARIENGRLTPIPQDEGALWNDLAQRLGDRYGSFAPIDPLIAEIAVQAIGAPKRDLTPMAAMVRQIRLGAARQHVDAVLIYEPAGKSRREDTALQLLNWTVVGYYVVPSTEIEADGHAQALFMDVRNGYPYATLQGNGRSSGITASNSAGNSLRARADTARLEAVKDLVGQIEPALQRLDGQLGAKQ
jgi:hypothetical protein